MAEITDHDAVAQALDLIERAEAVLAQARGRLQDIGGQQSPVPYLDAKTAARVAKLGEVAHRHMEHIERHGSMTRADSLAIRRDLYGQDVQSTANLFGRQGSGALFWRDRPYGAPIRDDDPVGLTEEGVRIARLWRATQARRQDWPRDARPSA